MDHAKHESKYLKNLIEARQQDEDDFAYIIRIQNLYNINIWAYTPCGGCKVELFKPVHGSDKDSKDVRIFVWGNGPTEHCALIKTIETQIEKANRSQHKFYFCNRGKYWFNSQFKYNKHECSHSFKPEIICPKKKQITFINEHKRQNLKNIITADMECCVVDVTTGGNKYVIEKHLPVSVGYI